MKTFQLLVICSIIWIGQSIHPEANLNFTNYCKYYNYPVDTHKVITQDGYILTLFRIQKKGSTIRGGLKPILIQHGLLDSSDSFLINDENKAPGFILANKGYDVWFSNSRGNKYSRNHTKFNPNKDKQYWQFTYQHMADFDLPAAFTYINKLTKQKIHYIGHSQGTIQMHVALSKRNQVVQNLLDKYFGWGPVAYANHANSSVINVLDRPQVLNWLKSHGVHQFLPNPNWYQTDIGILFCAAFKHVCADFIGAIMDADPELDNYDRYDVLAGHEPSGTSLMNMEHWKQTFDHGIFRAFDYGSKQLNKAHYGSQSPPIWNLGNIRVPIRLFAGSSDRLADITDVQKLWKQLDPQIKTFYKVYNAGHLTFMLGKTVQPWMNDLFIMLDS